jgi:hypothetical protein
MEFRASELDDGFGSYACEHCGEPQACHLDVKWQGYYFGGKIATGGRCDPERVEAWATERQDRNL